MKQALLEAEKAFQEDEIPVGAVVVHENRIIARAYNQTERLTDVTAHAEMLAITAAAQLIGAKYLTACKLYVTLEPCIMCSGAIFWSQLRYLCYGASDPKRGFERVRSEVIHSKTVVQSGLMEEACSSILKRFFQQKR